MFVKATSNGTFVCGSVVKNSLFKRRIPEGIPNGFSVIRRFYSPLPAANNGRRYPINRRNAKPYSEVERTNEADETNAAYGYNRNVNPVYDRFTASTPAEEANKTAGTSFYNEASVGVYNDSLFRILNEPKVMVQRIIEYGNLFLGFEQANNYNLLNQHGQVIGYLRERDITFTKIIMRQFFKLHRPFNIDLIDLDGKIVMNIQRDFSLINSRIKIKVPKIPYYESDNFQMSNQNPNSYYLLGETQQQWHLWRRKYNLFEYNSQNDEFNQFGKIDGGLLTWDFVIKDKDTKVMSEINRTWGGLGIEFFTDVALYIVRFDKKSGFNDDAVYWVKEEDQFSCSELNLNEKAVLLGNTISIDFDYFSRHSRGGGGGFMLLPFWGSSSNQDV